VTAAALTERLKPEMAPAPHHRLDNVDFNAGCAGMRCGELTPDFLNLEATLTSDADAMRQRPPRPEPSVDAVLRLEDENLQLKEAVTSHAVVDQAIGVVLAVGQLTPEEGWNVLRGISQNTNIKLRHVAELIVDWARTGSLPTDIRSQLEQELRLGDPQESA
jgi:hypothetical protein